ncbi:ATP-binding cassette domain-containing protein, partial [Staphylococcus saccharolyticus]|uniref:ATP-binding cassette domain-containing protein n=4 Tax=Staphylococcus TaxID=1279 RepID=UPI0032E03438
MLEISNLEVKYKNFSALKIKEKIKVNENDFVGVIGSNGAGKTTLIKAITNQVHYKGSIVKPNKISVHLQENNYPTVLTCKTIIEGLLKTTIKKDKKLKNLIDYFDFNDLLKRKVGQLSGGQKQKITLIMVLYQEAPLTCFDEMTTGLDFEARNKLMENIQAWYKEKKAALLLISHYYEELEKLANKLLIIDKGEIIDFDYIDKLFLKHVGYSAIVVEDENLEMF